MNAAIDKAHTKIINANNNAAATHDAIPTIISNMLCPFLHLLYSLFNNCMINGGAD